jgi:hypothetical protein
MSNVEAGYRIIHLIAALLHDITHIVESKHYEPDDTTHDDYQRKII